MKWIPIILVFIVTSSYSQEIENLGLLTQFDWVLIDSENNLGDTLTFNESGLYHSKLYDIEVTGKWMWVDKNEIYVLNEGLKFDSYSADLNNGLGSKSRGHYIRILSIDENELMTLRVVEGDDWDSGFASEGRYKAISPK